MSEDSRDPPDDGSNKVARLHPPRIPHHPTLDRAIQGLIGSQLRSMYEHYVEQPIPDRLVKLVERLGEGSCRTEVPGAAACSEPGSDEGRA